MNEEQKANIYLGLSVFAAAIAIYLLVWVMTFTVLGINAVTKKYDIWMEAKIGEAHIVKTEWKRKVTIKEIEIERLRFKGKK